MNGLKRIAVVASTAVFLALGLAACGGSDGRPKISKVYVMGDSLADVGTFGLKFTVQDASNTKGFPIWTQLVASSFGVDGSAQCNFYAFTGTTFAANSQAGCTNYAIGGGRIRVKDADGGNANPLTVGTQMAAKAASGAYTGTDLVLIDGGGNDSADLVAAYLGAGSQAGMAAYQAFLLQQLDSATIASLISAANGANGPAMAAAAYMKKLADTFHGQIKANVLDKGANYVAVLNAPDITLTPRFKMVLAGVAAQGGAGGPAQAEALAYAIRQWIGTFNAQLKANIGSDSRVALVDFYADLTDQATHPAKYGLTDVANPVCPVDAVSGPDGLPSYTFKNCTSTALDAAGKTPGWWKTYAFSDGFHPTPKGHELMAASVARAIAQAGWL